MQEAIGQIEWIAERGLLDYQQALEQMEHRVDAIHQGVAPELIWLLEHPPLYTAGTSADPSEFRGTIDFPVHNVGRGGRYTYHGPGQRVGYVMLDLKKRGRDVRQFVWSLEQWIIDALTEFGLDAGRREGRIGVWVAHGSSEAKIAALGVRLRRWVSFHGISINVDPDLDHFQGIIPCGIDQFGVTSLADLGIKADIRDVDQALKKHAGHLFHITPPTEEA